mgnify:CR=1 FL=1
MLERRVRGQLHRAVDPQRDQSYFLFATTPAQLGLCRFPLGDYPDKHIYIETKHPTIYGPEVDEQTLRSLRYAGLHESENVHVISFSHRAVRYFTEMAPELETFYLFRLKEMRWNRKNRMLSRPYGVGPALQHLQLRRELLGHQGLKTYTWTVNTPRQMQWCADNGVDVIATDLPDVALATFGQVPSAALAG